MKHATTDAGPAASPGVPAEVTILNRLPSKHPQRLAFEDAVRGALAGLTGRWDVVVELPGALSMLISVVGPDGSAWTLTCCNPEHRNPESIAGIVRAACRRRQGLDSPEAAPPRHRTPGRRSSSGERG